ncbi:hypothetical protein SNEBB_005988 [Seison nebaliae]|nr:hypothetical protein SNEBB_005988 [Seison nebaliae]
MEIQMNSIDFEERWSDGKMGIFDKLCEGRQVPVEEIVEALTEPATFSRIIKICSQILFVINLLWYIHVKEFDSITYVYTIFVLVQICLNYLICLDTHANRLTVTESQQTLTKIFDDAAQLEIENTMNGPNAKHLLIESVQKRVFDIQKIERHRCYEERCCNSCKIFQVARSVHCDMCHWCVLKRQFHSHLTNTCIGHFTYRYYMQLLFYLAIFFGIAIWATFEYCEKHKLFEHGTFEALIAIIILMGNISTMTCTVILYLILCLLNLKDRTWLEFFERRRTIRKYEDGLFQKKRFFPSKLQRLREIYGDPIIKWPLYLIYPIQLNLKNKGLLW